MAYTIEPGKVLRKRLVPRMVPGINAAETHAILITDIEHFVLSASLRAALYRTPETDDLAARVLRVGLDWEHHQALLPNDPDQRSAEDVVRQEQLAAETEILAAEIDVRTGAVDAEGNPFPPHRESGGGDA